MEVFIEFKLEGTKSAVLARAKDLCEITARVREKNQYWFKPHNEDCHDEFTDWLEAAGVEYENV